jgi:nicotinamide mononucleotide transporter
MSVLGIIALVSGTLGVWLTIKQNIYCWPVSLVAVLSSIIEFYEQRLYGDMSLQVVYLFLGIYGWVYWNEKKKEAFEVKATPLKALPLLLLVTLLQGLLYYFLLLYFKGDRPVLDAALTAGSLTATYMMTKKWVENWLTWVFIDGTYILLYGLKEMWLFALLYLLFTVIAFYGWLKWRKTVL